MRRFLRLGATALRSTLPEDAQIGAPRWSEEEDVWVAYRDARSRGRVLTSIVVATKEPIEGDALMAVLTLDADEGSERAASVLETLVIGPAE